MKSLHVIPSSAREWRRFQALELRERGWSERRIAEALDVTEQAVSGWMHQAQTAGPEALRARERPGRRAALSAAQVQMLPESLSHGAEAYGFDGQVWTRARVGRVIEEEFGVRYHQRHVGRLLQALHWTPPMPITRAE